MNSPLAARLFISALFFAGGYYTLTFWVGAHGLPKSLQVLASWMRSQSGLLESVPSLFLLLFVLFVVSLIVGAVAGELLCSNQNHPEPDPVAENAEAFERHHSGVDSPAINHLDFVQRLHPTQVKPLAVYLKRYDINPMIRAQKMAQVGPMPTRFTWC